MSVLVSAVLCGNPPPLLANGTFSPLQFSLGAELTYQCLEGWFFADGETQKTIICNETTSSWEPEATIDQLQCFGNNVYQINIISNITLQRALQLLNGETELVATI